MVINMTYISEATKYVDTEQSYNYLHLFLIYIMIICFSYLEHEWIVFKFLLIYWGHLRLLQKNSAKFPSTSYYDFWNFNTLQSDA